MRSARTWNRPRSLASCQTTTSGSRRRSEHTTVRAKLEKQLRTHWRAHLWFSGALQDVVRAAVELTLQHGTCTS